MFEKLEEVVGRVSLEEKRVVFNIYLSNDEYKSEIETELQQRGIHTAFYTQSFHCLTCNTSKEIYESTFSTRLVKIAREDLEKGVYDYSEESSSIIPPQLQNKITQIKLARLERNVFRTDSE